MRTQTEALTLEVVRADVVDTDRVDDVDGPSSLRPGTHCPCARPHPGRDSSRTPHREVPRTVQQPAPRPPRAGDHGDDRPPRPARWPVPFRRPSSSRSPARSGGRHSPGTPTTG